MFHLHPWGDMDLSGRDFFSLSDPRFTRTGAVADIHAPIPVGRPDTMMASVARGRVEGVC